MARPTFRLVTKRGFCNTHSGQVVPVPRAGTTKLCGYTDDAVKKIVGRKGGGPWCWATPRFCVDCGTDLRPIDFLSPPRDYETLPTAPKQ